MVQIGDFLVELVYADSKKPFKEHTKDSKVYVEVEPDTEYFISLQKLGTAYQGTSYVEFIVDEKRLQYYSYYQPNKADGSKAFKGLYQVDHGMEYYKALKFVKPKHQATGDKTDANLLLGKVEVKIYDGIFTGYKDYGSGYSYATNLSTSNISQEHAHVAAKKCLRTGEGTTHTKPRSHARQACYTKGDLVDSVTLTYCAALGLVEAGVLPQPPHREPHRMKRSPEMVAVPEYTKKARGSGKEDDAILLLDED